MLQRNLNCLAVCACLCTVFSVTAQSRRDTTLGTKDLTFSQEYNPVLSESIKVESVPVIQRKELKTPTFNYATINKQVSTEKRVQHLAPVSYRDTSKNRLYGNYAKIGGGNLGAMLGELYLMSVKNPNFLYGGSYKHLSANPSNTSRDFSNNSMDIFGSRFTKNAEFGANFNYNRNRVNFFGNDTSFNFSEKNIAKSLENWEFHSFFNYTPSNTKKAHVFLDFGFYQFVTSGNISESNIFAKSIWNKNLNNKSDLRISAGLDVLSFNDSNRIFFDINPRYITRLKNTELELGLNATLFSEARGEQFFPNLVAKIKLPLVTDQFFLTGGIDGQYNKQSYRNLQIINPFSIVTNNTMLKNEFESFRAFVGVFGKLTNNTTFTFDISHSTLNKTALFVTNKDSFNSFGVLYDNGSVAKVSASVQYNLSNKIRIDVRATYYSYNMSTEDEAWMRPTADFYLKAKYNFNKKLSLFTNLYGMSNRNARIQQTSGFKANQVNGFVDIQLGTDYQFHKNAVFFIKLNNLTTMQYQQWYNYPNYGFAGLAGFSIML